MWDVFNKKRSIRAVSAAGQRAVISACISSGRSSCPASDPLDTEIGVAVGQSLNRTVGLLASNPALKNGQAGETLGVIRSAGQGV